jgi:hypothetical protein
MAIRCFPFQETETLGRACQVYSLLPKKEFQARPSYFQGEKARYLNWARRPGPNTGATVD